MLACTPRPRRGTLLLTFLLTSAGFSPAQEPPPPSPSPTFETEVELVTVDAVVLDRRGEPVEGLTADEFQIEEDGRPQRVVSFEAVALPESAAAPRPARVSTNTAPPGAPRRRTFVIVFDDVHMAPERIGPARAAVTEFVASALRPGDEVTLVPTSGGAWWTAEMPEGSGDLAAALLRLQGLRPRVTSVDRISDWEAMRLYLHRDPKVMSEVARRYYEHRIILEPLGVAERAEAGLQISPGLPLIQAKSAEVYQAALDRKRATLAVLERVAASLASVKGRKSVILVSEGFVHEPQLPEFRELVRATRQANAAIYFLDGRGLRGAPVTADAEIAEGTDPRDLNSVLNENLVEAQGADSIAIDSGGFSIKGSNDLAAGLRRIAGESRSYYLLGYQPPRAPRDGKFHRIEVRVRRPDLQVRARRGYYAPPEGEAPRRADDSLDPRVRLALDSPSLEQGVPLRMTSHVLGASWEGKATVVLVAEADPRSFVFEPKGDRFSGVLESYVVVSARATGENFHREKLIELSLPAEVKQRLERSWLPIVREFELLPGAYQARLLLRDRQGGRIGTVRHDFTVPRLDGLRTSTPFLTDTLQAAASGAPMPGRPQPVARRRFAPGQTLYYLFEVFGAQRDGGGGAPRISAGYEIQAGGGAVVAKQAAARLAPGPRGELVQVFVFSLQGVGPGEYEVVLHVQDEVAGKTLEVRDPFTVEAPGPAAAARGPG